MPINSPDIFCYEIKVDPVASIASNDKYDAIGDILPIAGTNCKSSVFTTGVLDDYPGATAAYSLRRLSSSWTGPAIRVKRQFTFDELDIGFKENGDLDTETMIDFSGGDAALFVDTLYDQTGNGFHAVSQLTFGPRIVNSNGTIVTLNGEASMVFDGLNDEALATDLLTEFDNTDFLVNAVFGDSGSGSEGFAIGSTGSVPRLYFQDDKWSYNTLNTMSWTRVTAQNVMQYQVNGNTQEVFSDNVTLATATEAQADFNPTGFLVGRIGSSTFMDGKLQEIIIYTSNQVDNRIGIYENMNSYWL
jgi:hypothetical protein